MALNLVLIFKGEVTMKKHINIILCILIGIAGFFAGYFVKGKTAKESINIMDSGSFILLNQIEGEGEKSFFENVLQMEEFGGISGIKADDLTKEELDLITRRDFPLIDLYFDRKDEGAVVINFLFGKQIYISTDVGSFEEVKDRFFVETFVEGRGVTPNFELCVYKNGKLVKSVEGFRINFAGIENTFFPVKITKEKTNRTIAKEVIKTKEEGFWLKCKITDTTVIDNNENVFDDKKAIEAEFKRLYGLKPNQVEVSLCLSHPLPDRYQIYDIFIKANKKLYKNFDKALLERDSFMKDIEIGDFQEEEYETIYYELL